MKKFFNEQPATQNNSAGMNQIRAFHWIWLILASLTGLMVLILLIDAFVFACASTEMRPCPTMIDMVNGFFDSFPW